jgi:hypothetical protein
MKFGGLGDFAVRLATMEADIAAAKAVAIEKACQIVKTEAKRVIGTYDYNWPQLAEATQEDRVKQGYPPNETLLRSGALRASIGHVLEREGVDIVGYVGSADKIAVYQELGTSRVPPRPFLGGATETKRDEVVAMMHRKIWSAMVNGGPAYHEFREIVHEAHKVVDAAKEFVEDATDHDGRGNE